NLTALLTARNVKKDQLDPALQPALMVSEQAHYCVDRAAMTMGWPTEAVIKIPVDSAFRMRTDLLEAHLAQAREKGLQVIAIVGSACSTSTGSYDDLNAIAAFAERHQLWMHVDGAHGACVVFSESHRPLIAGIDKADSLILDFHKMLMTPGLATALLYKDNRHGFQTFATEAAYLLDASENWYDTGKRTYECTKYMMSAKIFSIWQQHGEAAFAKYVDTCYGLARQFAEVIEARPGFEVATAVQSNILCFRWAGRDLSESEINQINTTVRQQLLEAGTFYIVQTTLNGRRYLRMTVMNPFSSSGHVNSLLDEIESLVSNALPSEK
ncbi:MAG: aminotransferase class I/II-fold pyridoxal phosphate-dependent enzyme, partial [Bacteroidota bacterium]